MSLEAAKRLAEHLRHQLSLEESLVTVTWLNHYSATVSPLLTAGTAPSIDFVGVDGLLLARLLGLPESVRTSADTVVPALLGLLDRPRVLAVGGAVGAETRIREALRELGAGTTHVLNGYEDRPTPAGLSALLEEWRPELVLLGLGPGLQDRYLIDLSGLQIPALALTCGGWLDQVQFPKYYPAWAYRMRLNWLVRFSREPRRLWRRYTIDAGRAWARRAGLRQAVAASPAYQRYLSVLS